MCVTWFKITFKASDRCVADCWVAVRLKSSPAASPALFPLTLTSISWDWEVGKSREWYTRQPERDEKDLPFPVKRGCCEARGYTHWNAISWSSVLHSRSYPERQCTPWKMAPITELTPADLWHPPSHLISLTLLKTSQLLTFHTPTALHSVSPMCAFALVMTS